MWGGVSVQLFLGKGIFKPEWRKWLL